MNNRLGTGNYFREDINMHTIIFNLLNLMHLLPSTIQLVIIAVIIKDLRLSMEKGRNLLNG